MDQSFLKKIVPENRIGRNRPNQPAQKFPRARFIDVHELVLDVPSKKCFSFRIRFSPKRRGSSERFGTLLYYNFRVGATIRCLPQKQLNEVSKCVILREQQVKFPPQAIGLNLYLLPPLATAFSTFLGRSLSSIRLFSHALIACSTLFLSSSTEPGHE